MNDLYTIAMKENGKTEFKQRDLGIRSGNIPPATFPTPMQIAYNAKRDTVSVSVRIDEVAYACLDLLSAKNNTSMSNFVNEILNAYIEEYRSCIQGFVFNHAINLSMKRFCAKLSKLTRNEVIMEYHADDIRYITENVGLCIPKKQPELNDFYDNFYEFAVSELPHFWYDTYIPGVTISITQNDKKTSFFEADEELQTTQGFGKYVVHVPVNKWYRVQPILSHFALKYRQLKGESVQEYFTQETLEQLIKVINHSGETEVVENLVELLHQSEYFCEPKRDAEVDDE